MSQFNRDEFMKQGPYQVTPTPFPGEGIFGGDTSFAESAQSFGGNFADYNIVTQAVDKLRGDHYTDNIAYAREQAREQEEALVGPKPLYDPFTDPKIQGLPDQFRKYGAGVESEREALAFMKTVNHYEAVKKNRMKSGGAAVSGMVMGELISPANIYGLRIAQSTKELSKIIGAFSAEELAQHALQPERTATESALNIGIIGGFNAAMLGHKKFKELAFTRAVPDYSGDVERVVLQHFDDTIDNFKQTNTASEAEVVPDLNDAIQVQKKRELNSVNDELPMEEGNLPEFQFIEEADPKLKNVDQRANPDNTIAPAWWLDKIPDGPVKRALKGSSYGKSIMTDLVEHPFVQLKNLGENPTATQAGVDRLNAINWQAPMVDTMQATEQLYLRYRQRVSDSSATTMTGQVVRDLRGTGDAIGFDEFLGEVGKTKGNRGARTDIQEIVEASALWHEKVYKPMGEAAKKSGMFSQNLQRARSLKLAELKEARRAGTPEAIKAIQSELDDIAKQIDEADNIDLSPNFLNRIYKKDEIKSRRAEFTNILINRGGRSEEEASGIIDAILGQTARHAELDIDGPAIEMGKVGRAASLKERSLDDIDDIDFGDFLEHNIFAVGKYYTSRVGPDIELTRKFGSIDMHDQLKAISDAHDLRIKNAAPHEVDKFKAMKDQELDDIRVVRDRIRGTYGLPDNPDSYTNRGMRIAKMMNATTMLTGAISAVPDMGRLVMYDGMTRSFGTVFDALTRSMDNLAPKKVSLAVPLHELSTGSNKITTLFRGSGGGGKVSFSKNAFGDGEYFAVNNKTAKLFGKNVVKENIQFDHPFVIKSDQELMAAFDDIGINTSALKDAEKRLMESVEENTANMTLRAKDRASVSDEVAIAGVEQFKKLEKEFLSLSDDAFEELNTFVRNSGHDGAVFSFGKPNFEQATSGNLNIQKAFKEWQKNAASGHPLLNNRFSNDQAIVFNKGEGRVTAGQVAEKTESAFKQAKNEAQLAGEALDMYLSMRAALFTDLSDAMSTTSQFERIAAKGTQQFFNVSLMNPWNVGVKTLASLITGSRILEESIKWASPLRNSAGVPVKYGEVISNFNGNRIAASYNPKTKEITMDLEKLRESYDRKGWTQPRNGVTPLPEKQFKNFEEFRDFVIEHELAHTDFRPNKGETIPQYEDRINQIALKRVGHRGKPSVEFEQSKLAQSGIDANMAGRISAQFEQYGMREGRVMIAQTKKWKDRGAAQAYTAALGKDINTIIVTPGAGDLPSSMSGGLEKLDIAKGRKAERVAKVESGEELNRWEKIEDTFMGPQVAQMLFQFKSFGASATQRILVPGLQRPDKNFLIGAAGLVALGVMVDHIRDGQLGSKRPKTSSQRLKAGIDRSGMLGWFGDANGALETLSDGRFGIGPMMGDHGYKRSKLNKLGAVAGPSVSQGKNIARLLYGLSDGSMGKRDSYYARSIMPTNRVFWADGFFDFTQSAIGPK